jgi:hypothetical protein
MVAIKIYGGTSVNKSAQYLIPLVLLASANAGAAEGLRATEVMKGAVTIRGQSIRYPATASPEVTAMLVELAPGGASDRHQHPVPPISRSYRGPSRSSSTMAHASLSRPVEVSSKQSTPGTRRGTWARTR